MADATGERPNLQNLRYVTFTAIVSRGKHAAWNVQSGVVMGIIGIDLLGRLGFIIGVIRHDLFGSVTTLLLVREGSVSCWADAWSNRAMENSSLQGPNSH